MGYDPTYGARPLKRVIQKHLVDRLALGLLQGDFAAGDRVRVDATDGRAAGSSASVPRRRSRPARSASLAHERDLDPQPDVDAGEASVRAGVAPGLVELHGPAPRLGSSIGIWRARLLNVPQSPGRRAIRTVLRSLPLWR